MSFAFDSPRPRRRPSLTAMIDVVFLLLVFFMLAARFGQDGALPLTVSGGTGTAWDGPPRLIDIAPSGLEVNGRLIEMDGLEQALTGLTETRLDPVLLRPDMATDLQRLLDVMAALETAGFTTLILVEP